MLRLKFKANKLIGYSNTQLQFGEFIYRLLKGTFTAIQADDI